MRLVADFGDLPVFQEATTYPCILQLSKTSPRENFAAADIKTLDFKTSLDDYVEAHQSTFSYDDLHEDGWNLGDQKVLLLLEKLKNAGTPLGEFVNHQIYYGIKTGLNEAFVIDAETRARLIAEDPQSEKIIKPFLAGRDIKRYQQPKSDKFLILFEKGHTDKSRGKTDAKDWLKSTFPAIHQHLIQYKEAAAKRYDKGDYWWELRACDYYAEFEKTKISYPDISKAVAFTLDNRSSYQGDTSFFIASEEKWLLAILNSSLVNWFYPNVSAQIRGSFLRFKTIYVQQIPICHLTAEQKVLLEELAQKVLSAKTATPQQDTTEWEAEIDALVYELYGLTAEEIEVVESA